MITLQKIYIAAGVLLCFLAGLFSGGYFMARHYEPMMDFASQKIGSLESANEQMAMSANRQNEFIENLKKLSQSREESAAIALSKAKLSAEQSQKEAQIVLMTKAPLGINACESASKAFDDELRFERNRP